MSNRFIAEETHPQAETMLLMVNHYDVDKLLQRSTHAAHSLRQKWMYISIWLIIYNYWSLDKQMNNAIRTYFIAKDTKLSTFEVWTGQNF